MPRLVVILLVAWCWYSCARRCPAPLGRRGANHEGSWYVDGVRPDGTFEFAPVLGEPERDLDDAHELLDILGPDPVPGRLRCAQGKARQDGVSVWCEW